MSRKVAACPACKTSSFSTSALSPAAAASLSAASSATSNQKSAWSAIRQAADSILHPPALAVDGASISSPDEPSPTLINKENSTKPLSTTAAALLAEIKLRYPSRHQTWSLFSQLDLENQVDQLPNWSLHAIISALCTDFALDKTKKGRGLTVKSATHMSHTLENKIERVRMRLRERQLDLNAGDLKQLAIQYYKYGYAPGACAVWDECVDKGVTLSKHICMAVYGAMERWIELHQRAGGRSLAQAAAAPLTPKAVSMIYDFISSNDGSKNFDSSSSQLASDREAECLDVVIPRLFTVLRHGRDRAAFAAALKTFYGFDLAFPGAEVEAASQSAKSRRRQLGEEEVQWILDFLRDEGTFKSLSSMMAVFEVCDAPSSVKVQMPDTESSWNFFGSSFRLGGPSSPLLPDTPLTQSSTAPPPIVGSRALASILELALELDQASTISHYLDVFCWRWLKSVEHKLAKIEQVVGIETEPFTMVSLERPMSERQRKRAEEQRQALLDAGNEEAAALIFLPPEVQNERPSQLGVGDHALQRDYRLSSRFVADAAQKAWQNRDATSLMYIRRRADTMYFFSKTHARRLAAIIDRLEPSRQGSSPGTDDSLAPTSTSNPEASPLSETSVSSAGVGALVKELSSTMFHMQQLRAMLPQIRIEANVLEERALLRNLVAAAAQRARLIEDSKGERSKAVVDQMRAAQRRTEVRILRQRMMLARMYMIRLKKLGKADLERREFAFHREQWRMAKQRLERRGESADELEGEEIEPGTQ
ncbi:hypothetical protein T439DRAFT_329576 [Meredithblackwellia eburnea MCA 4105]